MRSKEEIEERIMWHKDWLSAYNAGVNNSLSTFENLKLIAYVEGRIRELLWVLDMDVDSDQTGSS